MGTPTCRGFTPTIMQETLAYEMVIRRLTIVGLGTKALDFVLNTPKSSERSKYPSPDEKGLFFFEGALIRGKYHYGGKFKRNDCHWVVEKGRKILVDEWVYTLGNYSIHGVTSEEFFIFQSAYESVVGYWKKDGWCLVELWTEE